MIKAVFLDIDNTLLSFTGYVKDAMKQGFKHFGLKEYKEEMFDTFNQINEPLWRQIEKGEITLPELKKVRWNMVFEALGIDFDGVEFESYFRKYLFSSAILEENALELLQYLDGKYVICAASNGPYEQQINRLRVGQMYEYFDHVFVSEKIGYQKPAKEFFEYCFRELKESGKGDILPEEMLMIGDSLTSDMAGGIICGMKTCLYTKKEYPPEKLEDIDYVVSDLKEIMEIL